MELTEQEMNLNGGPFRILGWVGPKESPGACGTSGAEEGVNRTLTWPDLALLLAWGQERENQTMFHVFRMQGGVGCQG